MPSGILSGSWEGYEVFGSEQLFVAIHDLGVGGLIGLLVALVLRWLASYRRGPSRWRMVEYHRAFGLVFGIAAMLHGTTLFIHEIAEEQEWLALVDPGSLLCTSVFFLVVSGLLRTHRWRAATWRLVHRIAAIAFGILLIVHLVTVIWLPHE